MWQAARGYQKDWALLGKFTLMKVCTSKAMCQEDEPDTRARLLRTLAC